MGQGKTRRNRRSRFQKPDTINIILGSLTVVLLFVWGGFYWNESSQQELTVNANGAGQTAEAQPQEVNKVDGAAAVPPSASPDAAVKPAETEPAKPADTETAKPTEQAADMPADNAETGGEAAATTKPAVVKPAAPVKTARPVQTAKPSATNKPSQETAVKPDTTTTPKPVVTETEPPESLSEKYEQQLVQLQAKCTQDMNEVLVGAEASIEKMDKSDPYAFQELNQKWSDSLAKAEDTCNTKFQGIIAKAEKDAVEPEVIEEWEQTFSNLMLQLQSEFEAKILQLMGS